MLAKHDSLRSLPALPDSSTQKSSERFQSATKLDAIPRGKIFVEVNKQHIKEIKFYNNIVPILN
jgi:hypothetical protein